MSNSDQKKAPYVEAIKHYVSEDVIPFDVPGHHMGNINNPATALLGSNIYRLDLNAPVGLDNLSHPAGVLMESHKLLAEACGADEAFFLVNGTSCGIIAMIMTAVKANEKIILPRNVHKSVINALIISGAVPAYVMPEIDDDLEIANQPTLDAWKKAILKNPSAKAIFVINPTYFGSIGNLKELVAFAHEHNMAVLVDEAHGAHYYFGVEENPDSAMKAGADMSAASFHKTVGSLTQSSVLLLRNGLFDKNDVQKALNILNTTSPSGILMASLDGARQFMASEEGKEAMRKTYELARYAREKISKIKGFVIEGRDHFLEYGSYNFDETKLVIGVDKLDIDGFKLYALLKKDYNIQMELAETYEIMGVLAIGTTKRHIDKLIAALKDISKKHYDPKIKYKDHTFETSFPFMLTRPRVAFHAPGIVLPVEECVGEISKEQIMMYPPGIPLIVPGEVWTRELVRRVKHYQKAKGEIKLLSSYEDGFEVIDRDHWNRFPVYEKRLNDYFVKRMTNPRDDGYTMPFEGEKHQATLILLPFRKDTWRDNAVPALNNYIEVIEAIAKHEKVIVGIHPSYYRKYAPKVIDIPNVEAISIKYNDSWARDNMPIWVRSYDSLRTVDFRFNSWGGEYNGLYSNYRDDDKLSQIISKRLRTPSYYLKKFVLEGGSIAVDGEGTLITTEACLLSKGRNPILSKMQIEETLKDYIGVEKVIWVPHGIYKDETDEHVDNMVAFVKPGVVVMASCKNKKDPQYKFCEATKAALENATDAKGRKLEVVELPLPSKPLFMSIEEAKALKISSSTKDYRYAGRRLAASYVNFYQGADFVILPAFGVKEDAEAYKIIKSLFPDKEIHQINTKEILLGGGNIHCITMQIPEKEY